FFFQAEDGIRDKLVTGVQTCALPIWGWALGAGEVSGRLGGPGGGPGRRHGWRMGGWLPRRPVTGSTRIWRHGGRSSRRRRSTPRSEERRVGKEWGAGWGEERCNKKVA